MRSLVFFLLPALAWCHDLDARVTVHPHSVVVEATYGGTESAPFISVAIFSPADSQKPFQSGWTDARGVFAFVPDRSGQWLCVLDDQLGHRKELGISVADGSIPAAGEPSRAPQPLAQKVLTGLSLLIGLTGVVAWFSARRARRPAP
jgi:nickel transport protein